MSACNAHVSSTLRLLHSDSQAGFLFEVASNLRCKKGERKECEERGRSREKGPSGIEAMQEKKNENAKGAGKGAEKDGMQSFRTGSSDSYLCK